LRIVGRFDQVRSEGPDEHRRADALAAVFLQISGDL
jgi:hypothetical protein